MPFMFENLDVYRRAVDLADCIITHTKDASRGFGFLTDQLNRAALSISTNLAEGNGRFTTPDRNHFFGIARGSLLECLPPLELSARRRFVDGEHHATLRTRLEEIARMISGLVNGLDARRA